MGLFGGKRFSQVFVGVPLLVWWAVVGVGILSYTGRSKAPPHGGQVFEWMFKRAGALFPFFAMVIRLAVAKTTANQQLPPKYWEFSKIVAAVYLMLTIVRAVVFWWLPKDTLSDHIFLSLSVSAMLQMEACFALEVWSPKPEKKKQKKGGKIAWAKHHLLLVVVAINLFIMLLLMHNSFYTAAYYHERAESWAALWAGTVLFQGCVAWALYSETVWCSMHGNTRGVALAGTETVVVKGSRSSSSSGATPSSGGARFAL